MVWDCSAAPDATLACDLMPVLCFQVYICFNWQLSVIPGSSNGYWAVELCNTAAEDRIPKRFRIEPSKLLLRSFWCPITYKTFTFRNHFVANVRVWFEQIQLPYSAADTQKSLALRRVIQQISSRNCSLCFTSCQSFSGLSHILLLLRTDVAQLAHRLF